MTCGSRCTRAGAQECEWVADQVEAAHTTDRAGGEIAVLVRARRDFADLHAALVARGIPVEVVGLGGLLSLPEVADVVATLEVIDDPTANAALLRLLTGPRWRIGVRDLAQLGRRGRELLRTDLDAVDACRTTRWRTRSPASTRATWCRWPTCWSGPARAAGRSRGCSG